MVSIDRRDGLWPDPPESPESAAFVAAAREGRFLLRRCIACGKAHWYPRARCPFCLGETAWEEASGVARCTAIRCSLERLLRAHLRM